MRFARSSLGDTGSNKSVKELELEALLAAPEGYGEDLPVNPDFHARRLPDRAWRESDRVSGVADVTQLHRLREVLALAGFTRFEAVTPTSMGSTTRTSSALLSPGSLAGSRPLRTEAKGCSCGCARKR